MSVKITILGAGSAVFSGNVIRDLCINSGLHGSHVCLMDTSEERLNIVRLLVSRLNEELSAGLSISTTTDRRESLQGADFVINTALDGGHDMVEHERSFAEEWGYYRGARLGQIRQMVFFMEVIRDMEEICPDAWLFMSANPVFEGCTLMHRNSNIKVLGLCHGHYGYQKIGEVLGLDKDKITAKSHGFNHCIWMTDFLHEGKDAYPILDEWIATKSEQYWKESDDGTYKCARAVDMSRAAIHQYQFYGLMGIGDTPRFANWYYGTDLETRKKYYNSWGGYDSELTWKEYLKRGTEKIATMDATVNDTSKPITETFKPYQSKEQIMPIINSLINDEAAVYQVNIPNTGLLVKGFPEDLVVEVEAVIDGTGIQPIQPPQLPSKVVQGTMMRMWQRCERRVQALHYGDKDFLTQLFLDEPYAKGVDHVEDFIKAWLVQPQCEKLNAVFENKGF